MNIEIYKLVGGFAENKDIARDIRVNIILPALEKDEEVTLDFINVKSATQSFIHALISDVIRRKGIGILDFIYFKNCNETVKKIVEIVVEYMQDQT